MKITILQYIRLYVIVVSKHCYLKRKVNLFCLVCFVLGNKFSSWRILFLRLWELSTASLYPALREKCQNAEFFLFRIQSDCGKIRTRKYTVFGHFSRSAGVIWSISFGNILSSVFCNFSKDFFSFINISSNGPIINY